MDFRVEIDESVTPALIDFKRTKWPMTGIVKFQAGLKNQSLMFGSRTMTSGESGMTMEEGSAGAGVESPGSGFATSSGEASMVTASEPDRLLICVTEGPGLRPREFQMDHVRGHNLFSLVRSREAMAHCGKNLP
ncbi:MAG: hypothetical protein ACKVHE_24595 [Planctomycetales bacterium]|jgi:hypothetical protein